MIVLKQMTNGLLKWLKKVKLLNSETIQEKQTHH